MVRTQGCTCTYEYSEKCSFVYFVLNVCHLLFHRKTFVLTSIVGLNLHMSEKVALKVSSDSQKTVSSKLPCWHFKTIFSSVYLSWKSLLLKPDEILVNCCFSEQIQNTHHQMMMFIALFCSAFNPLPPYININILSTSLYTFPLVLTRRICSTIKLHGLVIISFTLMLIMNDSAVLLSIRRN